VQQETTSDEETCISTYQVLVCRRVWETANIAIEDADFREDAWPRLVAAMSHYCGDVHLAGELVQKALVGV
jgi:hypothetical protein